MQLSQDPWEADYIKSLLAIASSLTADRATIDTRIEALKVNTRPNRLEACELELLLLRLKNRDELVQDLPGLRARLAALDPSSAGPKSADTANDGQVLAEAFHLVQMIHRGYFLGDQLEKTRQKMISLMVMAAAVVIACLVISIYLRGWDVRIVDGVVFAGVLGGFTSCLRRISAVVQGTDTVAAIQTLSASRSSMIAAPLLGGVFAPLLYICFTGQLVSGVLFPTLGLIPDPNKTAPFEKFLFGTATGTESDFAKLLVWSFIAGFAERFLPDTLDRVIGKATPKE